MELKEILNKGITLETSGTTGTPAKHFQSPDKLKAGNRVAINAQELTASSRVYTVSKMSHAGGLLAQTLPAFSIGAEVVIDKFSPYSFIRNINKYTHTHLAPGHARAIMGTKGFNDLNLKGVWVTCGSDAVTWDIIRAFVERGATFMANWGMTEVGPIAINATYRNLEDVFYGQERANTGTILGNTHYCNHKIVNGCLYVKGDISVFGDEWYCTNDKVSKNLIGELFYVGRNDGMLL